METAPPTDPTVAALRELSQSFHQLAIALSVVAREGAKAEEIADRADNASRQAVTIAREVRDLARSINTKLEAQQKAFSDFFGEVLGEFGKISKRVKALEDTRAEESNGHG